MANTTLNNLNMEPTKMVIEPLDMGLMGPYWDFTS